MVHTANFFLTLRNRDIIDLIDKHGLKVSQISDKLNQKFKWQNTKLYFAYREEGYSLNYWVLEVFVDFIQLLGKYEINEDDFNKIEEKMDEYLYETLGHLKYTLTLNRLDYRLDFKIKKEEREVLLKLYRKSYQFYGHKSMSHPLGIYTTIYFQSKSTKITIYDKEIERIDKCKIIQPEEKDVLRMEVSLLNKHLNYKKYKYNMQKELKNYFKKDFFDKYIQDNLYKFLKKGNYYKINLAVKIINESDLKKNQKEFLKRFLIDVSNSNLSSVLELKNKKGELKYSTYKRNQALKMLEELDINPICIPKNWKCPNYIKNPLKTIKND